MKFNDLSVEELRTGYIFDKESNKYVCIFCGEDFEEGIVQLSRGRYITAERAVQEHLITEHKGVFHSLLNLDKDVNGLSVSQKNILEAVYEGKDNKTISEELDINVATVRTHKFNIQKMKKEAKILLAILEHVENKELIQNRKQVESSLGEEEQSAFDSDFEGNNLHPFFTKIDFK